MHETNSTLTHQPGDPQNRSISLYVLGAGLGVVLVVIGTFLAYQGIIDKTIDEAEAAPFQAEWTDLRAEQARDLARGHFSTGSATVVLPVDLAAEKYLRAAR